MSTSDQAGAMNLHVGGQERKDGWKILNVLPGPDVDYVGDLRDLSRFADESIDNLYASHVLEHVSQTDVLPVLRGVYRTLRRGGRFLVSVPDLDVLCHLFISPWAPPMAKWHAMRMIFGGQLDAHDFHNVGFNELFLRDFLAQAGFSDVQRVKSLGVFHDTSEYEPYGFPISLNLIAVK
jgi:predicted SAM-dependent methyltransferase